jgi:hypothetical protein
VVIFLKEGYHRNKCGKVNIGDSFINMQQNSNRKDRLNDRKKHIPLMATMAVLGLLNAAGPVEAANPAAKPTAPTPSASPFNELKGLERRFFFHEYDHDPLEKRLERIELLVFGAAQEGENTARLQRLRSAVLMRDREAAQRLEEKNRALKSPTTAAPKATAPTSSAQYPILQTLEWRALQKTYGTETLDQRLDRLETSLLGQPSPAMSYADRIDRLKKIIGVETAVAPFSSKTPLPRGPLPKASARRNSGSPMYSPYITPLPRSGGGDWDGDGDDDSTFEDDLRGQMTNDLQAMMEMMQRMQRAPGFGGMPGMLPFGGRGVLIPSPGEGATPYAVPAQPKRPKLPPYADPNSI